MTPGVNQRLWCGVEWPRCHLWIVAGEDAPTDCRARLAALWNDEHAFLGAQRLFSFPKQKCVDELGWGPLLGGWRRFATAKRLQRSEHCDIAATPYRLCPDQTHWKSRIRQLVSHGFYGRTHIPVQWGDDRPWLMSQSRRNDRYLKDLNCGPPSNLSLTGFPAPQLKNDHSASRTRQTYVLVSGNG